MLARKRFSGTVAANVLRHGTGALNIDGCRIEGEPVHTTRNVALGSASGGIYGTANVPGVFDSHALGRWPANVLLDEEAAALLDEQSGELVSGDATQLQRNTDKFQNTFGAFAGNKQEGGRAANSGGASRFFYTAKAGRSEREEGLYGEERAYEHSGPRGHAANGDGTPRPRPRPRQNNHPTVKPIDLMQWLVRLVTPRGGTVLDPFTGSGTTGMAALAEGFDFVGVEREAEYVEIARRRIASVAPLLAREVDA